MPRCSQPKPAHGPLDCVVTMSPLVGRRPRAVRREYSAMRCIAATRALARPCAACEKGGRLLMRLVLLRNGEARAALGVWIVARTPLQQGWATRTSRIDSGVVAGFPRIAPLRGCIRATVGGHTPALSSLDCIRGVGPNGCRRA